MTTRISILFVAHLIAVIFFVCTVFAFSPVAFAAEKPCSFTSASGLLQANSTSIFTSDCSPDDLGNFINSLNTFFYRLAIVLAVLMVTIGGMQWLMAIGNTGKISNAKETIQQAILGLILALVAVLLFNQIDDSFTNLDIQNLELKSMVKKSCDENLTSAACIAADMGGKCTWVPKKKKDEAGYNYFEGDCVPAAECSNTKVLAASFNTSPIDKAVSPQLQTMIDCLKKEVSDISLGTLYTFDQSNPKCNFTRGNEVCGKCAHTVNSCHYGGRTGNLGSEAVDFNTAANTCKSEYSLYQRLKALKNTCGIGYIGFEWSVYGTMSGAIVEYHTHVSTQSCDGDAGEGKDVPSPC